LKLAALKNCIKSLPWRYENIEKKLTMDKGQTEGLSVAQP
jgi:hypothetical protein